MWWSHKLRFRLDYWKGWIYLVWMWPVWKKKYFAMLQLLYISPFHPYSCFKQTPIGPEGFHIEDGNVYSLKAWNELFTTKCYGCEFPIEPSDRWVEALGQNWHAECFNCAVSHAQTSHFFVTFCLRAHSRLLFFNVLKREADGLILIYVS